MAPVQSQITGADDKVPCKSPLELKCPPAVPLQQKHQMTSFKKLRTIPTQEDLQTHSLSLLFFDTSAPEHWLECQEVITRQNTATGLSVAKRLLTEDALGTFETEPGNQNHTPATFEAATSAVATHIFLPRAFGESKKCCVLFHMQTWQHEGLCVCDLFVGVK